MANDTIDTATVRVEMPAEFKVYLDERVALVGWGDASQYLVGLIADDRARQDRQVEREKLEAMLIEGLDSGIAEGVTIDSLRDEMQATIDRVREEKFSVVGAGVGAD